MSDKRSEKFIIVPLLWDIEYAKKYMIEINMLFQVCRVAANIGQTVITKNKKKWKFFF